MKEVRKPEYPEKSPGDELQKLPHTKARRFKPQARLEPHTTALVQARKADVLTVTPHVAPNTGFLTGFQYVMDVSQYSLIIIKCIEPCSSAEIAAVVVLVVVAVIEATAVAVIVVAVPFIVASLLVA